MWEQIPEEVEEEEEKEEEEENRLTQKPERMEAKQQPSLQAEW